MSDNTGAELFCPYNESFKEYSTPCTRKRAQKIIDRANTFKGGHWVLHTVEQYETWKKAKAQEKREAMEVWRRATRNPNTCPNCGGTMKGDGYTVAVRCEFSEQEEEVEPDASPVYCGMNND